jgi:hypothetical protein
MMPKLREKARINEIPRQQRFADRPVLPISCQLPFLRSQPETRPSFRPIESMAPPRRLLQKRRGCITPRRILDRD